jgi:hypothetical protein
LHHPLMFFDHRSNPLRRQDLWAFAFLLSSFFVYLSGVKILSKSPSAEILAHLVHRPDGVGTVFCCHSNPRWALPAAPLCGARPHEFLKQKTPDRATETGTHHVHPTHGRAIGRTEMQHSLLALFNLSGTRNFWQGTTGFAWAVFPLTV